MILTLLLSGKAESGKDTFYNIVKELYPDKRVVRVAHADELKEIAAKIFGWNKIKDNIGRNFLQVLGDGVRILDDCFWAKKLIERTKYWLELPDILIVTDCRYPNEFEYLKNNIIGNRIVTVRINRLNHESALTEEQKNHISETALDNYQKWDWIVANRDKDEYREIIKSGMEVILNGYFEG